MNPLLKFTVEVVDVFNSFAAAVFIVVDDDDDDEDDENDDDNIDDDVDNDDNDVNEDHDDDDDDGIEDDVIAVAKLCCSVETLITNFEFLAYDGVGDRISWIRETRDKKLNIYI